MFLNDDCRKYITSPPHKPKFILLSVQIFKLTLSDFYSLLFEKRVLGNSKCHVPGEIPTTWHRSRITLYEHRISALRVTGAGGKLSTRSAPGRLVEHLKRSKNYTCGGCQI